MPFHTLKIADGEWYPERTMLGQSSFALTQIVQAASFLFGLRRKMRAITLAT
jgi:hypothetical protein